MIMIWKGHIDHCPCQAVGFLGNNLKLHIGSWVNVPSWAHRNVAMQVELKDRDENLEMRWWIFIEQ